MIERPLWLARLHRAWTSRPVVWLSGVRRVGKTSLSHMLPDARYLNCDLPSVQRTLADPELFFDSLVQGSVSGVRRGTSSSRPDATSSR